MIIYAQDPPDNVEDPYILCNISKLLVALFSERDRLLHINRKNS